MLREPAPFRENRFLQALIIYLGLVWIIACISPFSWPEWVLENFLVVGYALLLTLTYRLFAFTNLSYGLFAIFMTLHLIGAHYTYANTPIGFWIQEWLGAERNPYDRIVHFAYGLLCAYAMRDILIRAAGVKQSWSYFLAILAILAFSAFYEMLEAWVAIMVTPELGVLWIGAQGDEWDAIKDTALAFSGAVVAMLITWLANRYSGRHLR